VISRDSTIHGTSRARHALVEGAWSCRHPAKVSREIQQQSESRPPAVQAIGWKAQVRLCRRYRRLVSRGKPTNVVVTAIAREMLAFMRSIARETPLVA